MQTQIIFLNAKIDALNNSSDSKRAAQFTSAVTKDSYDYLAIGNSITRHDISDYWWGEWGMAASSEELDYYHIVLAELKVLYNDKKIINSITCTCPAWEILSHDRAETWQFLDKYLAPGIDLITVQLSENVSDMTTFTTDFKALIEHIKTKCPNCKIIVIGDFWNLEKNILKKEICTAMGIDFADLSDICNKKEYKAGLNTIVEGKTEKNT